MVIPKNFIMVVPAFLLDSHHKREKMEKELTSWLALFLGKTLNWISLALCGREVVGSSILPVTVAQIHKRLANQA